MSAPEITEALAELGLSPSTTLGELKHRVATVRLAALLVDKVKQLPNARFQYVELPADGWNPERPRAEQSDDDDAAWIAMDRATGQQLERALAFALWQIEPDLQRLVDIVRNLQAAALKPAEETAA